MDTASTPTRIGIASTTGGFFYSTQPFLAWILNTYFYGDSHFVYVAPFLPYGLKNPVSSNPYELFGNLYKPWQMRDAYDAYVGNSIDQLGNKRLGLRKGVMALAHDSRITEEIARRLKVVCERCSVHFFCPVVYRVPKATVTNHNPLSTNSGLVGSTEFLLTDLRSADFEVLFFDYWDYPELSKLFVEQHLAPAEVLDLLEGTYE